MNKYKNQIALTMDEMKQVANKSSLINKCVDKKFINNMTDSILDID